MEQGMIQDEFQSRNKANQNQVPKRSYESKVPEQENLEEYISIENQEFDLLRFFKYNGVQNLTGIRVKFWMELRCLVHLVENSLNDTRKLIKFIKKPDQFMGWSSFRNIPSSHSIPHSLTDLVCWKPGSVSGLGF